MQLSKKCEYALRAIIYLASNQEGNNVITQISKISEKEKMPVKFLEAIMVTLKKGGILQSIRGTTGGYQLIKRPEKITLGEIIRIIDGDEKIGNAPGDGYTGSTNGAIAVLEQIVDEANNAASKVYDRTTIEEIVDRIGSFQNENLIYHI